MAVVACARACFHVGRVCAASLRSACGACNRVTFCDAHACADTARVRTPPLTIVATLVAACGHAVSSEAAVLTEHTVQPGETLSVLAARYGISMAAIQLQNGLGASTVVRAGQVLAIPPDTGWEGASTYWSVYEVVPGDTLSEIAATYDLDIARLRAVNDLASDDYLVVGQPLVLPLDVPAELAARAPTPTPVSLPTPTPAQAALAVIPTSVPAHLPRYLPMSPRGRARCGALRTPSVPNTTFHLMLTTTFSRTPRSCTPKIASSASRAGTLARMARRSRCASSAPVMIRRVGRSVGPYALRRKVLSISGWTRFRRTIRIVAHCCTRISPKSASALRRVRGRAITTSSRISAGRSRE